MKPFFPNGLVSELFQRVFTILRPIRQPDGLQAAYLEFWALSERDQKTRAIWIIFDFTFIYE